MYSTKYVNNYIKLYIDELWINLEKIIQIFKMLMNVI